MIKLFQKSSTPVFTIFFVAAVALANILFYLDKIIDDRQVRHLIFHLDKRKDNFIHTFLHVYIFGKGIRLYFRNACCKIKKMNEEHYFGRGIRHRIN